MRITGGTLKGRSVRVPDRPGLRPTSARVREALFHHLSPRLDGARVLDAFGGSGVLSLEAWSRGAGSVICLERDRVAARQVRDTVKALGAEVDVRVRDARRAPDGPFDLILADPPYADPPVPWVRALTPRLDPDGRLVLEHRAGALPAVRIAGVRVCWQRRYGDTELTIFAPVSD